MGKFFRGGRLISADAFNVGGTRTLAAATESDVWAGTAATRPVPGGIGLKVASSSAEDDNARQQSGTITIGGTMDPVTTDRWTCTVGGAVDTGDRARLTLNGVNYDTDITPALTTTALIATEVAASATSGSWDTWTVTIGGVVDENDVITLTVPGAGASPYVHTVTAGQTASDVATALAALVTADGGTNYSAASQAAVLQLVKLARGTGVAVTCTWTTDPGVDATAVVENTIIGVAGQAAWTVTSSTADVICTHATAGATADTVASSYTVDGGGASTFVAVHTTTGADADVLSVDDGTTTFSRTVASAVLADEVAALAASIDADAAYIATSAAGVITVTAAVDGVGFTFTDASTDNQTADLSVTIDNTAVLGNGGGTGIRTVRIDYVNTAGVRQAETVSCNGTTAVATSATDVQAVLAVSALTVGSTGAAVGNLTVTNGAETVQYAAIGAGGTADSSADYTVPAGNVAYVTALHASAGATATTIRLKSTTNPATGAVVAGAAYTWHTAIVGTDPALISPVVPLGPFPAGARVWATGLNAGGTAVAVTIEGYLEPA